MPISADTVPLRLDTTGQYLGGPIIGPHDNAAADERWLQRCVGALLRVV